MPNPTNRGGRRNPPGGRPLTTASGRKREKYSISLDPALAEWTIKHFNEPLSSVIERLLQERKGQEDEQA